MAKIHSSVESLIGKTPLLKLCRLKESLGLFADVLVKLESFNPAGSTKDRAAKAMLDRAEQEGLLRPETVIIEPTSGNTGIGLSMLAAARGYRVMIVMPETMSEERRKLIAAYGAELVLTEGAKGMAGAIEKANALAKELPSTFIPDQFSNAANAAAHFETTGPEIWEDTEGAVDFLVAGVGTGGTLTGTGGYLKTKNPALQVVAVEPFSSAVLSGEPAGAHGLQGIGAGFIPKVLNPALCDRIIKVQEEEAYEAGRLLAKKEGILAGISSGAALFAALSLAKEEQNKGKTIVAILPDTGDRYLSTDFFD